MQDRGSASTELVLVTPLLVLLLLVAVAVGHMATARLDADDAAHQAARAASLARTPTSARRQAQAVAAAALAGAGPSCSQFAVSTDVGSLQPGGVVRVRVSCTAALATAGLPAHVTVTKTASSVVDTFRGDGG